MKLTPEQKAFYEDGGAWETTVVIHTFIRRLLKDKGYQLSALKKWRVCRVWASQKWKCYNCKNRLISVRNHPCRDYS